MVFDETMMNYPDCKIIFIVHTAASGIHLDAIASQNYNIIDFY